MITRKTTGIQELDNLIEGGYKSESINMIEGTAGSGKSTLALHYAIAGVDSGEKALYLSVEESKKSFYENMNRFGFKLEEHEKTGNFIFYELNAQKLKDFVEKGVLGIEDKIIDQNISRIVLDSISAFTLLYETEAKQRIAVQRLFDRLRKWNLTTIIVSESEQDYRNFGLPYLVDGVLNLKYKKIGEDRIRTIEVLKMRGTKHRSKEVVYKIEDEGIVLYPGETVLRSDN